MPDNTEHRTQIRGCAHVGDGIGDEERRDLLVALLHHVLHAVLEHGQAAHARANEHAAPCLVQLFEGLGVCFLVEAGHL